jgi:2-keto-4-pentenoate hydratase/2-oxohepta-3-ene-1,7-dioic acid hydratase in catechol pathway
MKLATYVRGGGESFGVVAGDGIVDVPAAWPGGPVSLLDALRAGQPALARIAAIAAAGGSARAPAIPLADVRLRAPLPQPPKLLGLAVNYAEHHREIDRGHDLPAQPHRDTTPRPFLMPATAVAHPGEEIPWCDFSRDIDHEIELAVVIGRDARRVSPDEAKDCVAGYTIANDISARSATHAAGRAKRPKDDFFDWLHGKWADGFCPLGPWLVTADEIGDPQRLDLELTVDGEVRQKSSTRHMIFSVYELVSFCSHLMTLTPGDVIATGTPSGVGQATGKLLKPGQRITCRIEKIGELTNTLGNPPEKFYQPCEGDGGTR